MKITECKVGRHDKPEQLSFGWDILCSNVGFIGLPGRSTIT